MATVIAIFEDQYLKKKPLTVVGNGKQKRDFTHISDIVRGTYYAWNKNKKKEYLLYSGIIYPFFLLQKCLIIK